MAGGNLGDLFISLGIKDEMSKTLQKIVKGMNGVDQATQDAKKRGEELVASLNQVNGSNFSKIFREANEYIEKNSKGIANIAKILKGSGRNDANILTGKFLGAGNLAKIASLFGTINSELQRMSKNEDDADRVKAWQNRISNALAYIKLLQDINIQEKKISNTKAENPNVDTKSLDNAKKSLNELRESIISLIHSGGVDDSNILSSLTRVLGMAKKDVQDIISTFKKDNPLSAFTGGAAKVEADIARVTEKLAKMRDLMSEGTQKGYSTSMLTGSISELDNILTRLNAAKLNPTMLTDAAQMKNLISDVLVETIKATVAIQAYNREKGKIVTERKTADSISGAEKRQEKLISSTNILLDNIDKLNAKSITLGVDTSKLDYIRQEIGRIKSDIGSFAGKDLLGQSFKNTITELSAWREKANAALKDQSKENASVRADERQLEQTEARFRRVKELLSEVNRKIVEYNSSYDKGLKVGADISKIQNAIIGLSHFYDKLNQINVSDKKEVIELISEYRILTNKIGNAKAAQDKLNSSVEKINKSTDRQLGADLENTKRRIQSLDKALKNLQEKTFTSKMLGLDVSEATAKIAYLKGQLDDLRILRDRLERGDRTAVGQLGNLGNGREVQAANNLAASYDKANKEAQRGVEIERKRQQAIVDSGAKIQSQLVRGFEKANSHAGKLNSTVQDLKSLFLQGGLVFGAQQFAMSIITTGGEMEKQHIALQSILGDMQNANTMFNQIKELALNSPFTFSELNRDVKQLAAYGVEYDQLYDTTKRLADMSSGLGVSFDRIALAFGQVQARGWLDGKELRQIAYAGIPLLEKLSEFYSKQEGLNVSTSEIKTRISSRDVSFDDVKSIFWQMTDAGGQFYNMQQVLSETLLGRYNKLKDAWEIMLADFANGKNIIGGTFKGILDVVTNLVQQIHVLGPAMVAAFAGPALMRGVKTLEGGIGKRILNSKGNIAKEAELKLLRGEKITPVEKQILQYKNQIRIQDIQALAKANAITKAELRRLYVTGQITKEMYKQGMALTKQEGQVNRISLGGVLKGLASPSKWGAAGGLLLGGLKSGFSSIIGFLGGLPGIAISAGSAIFAYYWQKHQQLKKDMETTADELKDRYTKISEFLRDNDADKAIKDGDEKEIENLIDAYKEKLKEIAPEKENAFTMSLLEKKSNEDRLKYLKEQLILLKQVEESTQKSLSNEDTYKGFDEKLSSAKEIAEAFSSASAKANMINATQSDFASFNSWEEKYKDEVKAMRNYLINELGDISNSPELQGKANQILSSFFAKQGWNQDVSDQFRADVLNAMGVETGFYENKFKDALDNAVNTSFPWIGDKIRNNQELTDAEKVQVSNMMKDAAAQVQKDYPFASDALKRMLAADRFEAVIHLVFRNDDSDLTQQLEKNLKGSGYDYHEKNKYVKSWGKDAGYDYDKAKSNAESDITAAKKELNTRKKMLALGNLSLDEFTQKQKEYELKMQAYHDNWGEWFTGKGKKKNKKTGGRRSTGARTDKALEDLRKRIDLYKKMYAEIKKFKELYGEGALGQLANDGEFGAIFGDKKRFPISDYTNYETSIKELLKGFSLSTPERKHYAETQKAAIQSENRKLLQDQRRDELDLLNRELDVISAQYDTYKKLYELTGNKKGAENIAFDGAVQYDTYKKFLEKQLDIAVKHDNVQSGLKLTTDEVKGMSLDNVKDRYGSESRVYDIRKKLDDETRKIKQETIDLLANLVEKNATIDQQIEDENRKYERQLELIKGIKDTGMRDRATEGTEKTHNENLAKLEFERFKQGSDWVTIFDDLDRVSSTTINSMVEKIDEFSKTTGLPVEVVKQLRDALGKLRDEQIDRNPINGIIGGMQRGNAIGSFIDSRFRKGMDISTTTYVGADDAKKMGIQKGNYTKGQLESEQKGAYADANKATSKLAEKFKALQDCLSPVINLFEVLGEEDSFLGQATSTASGALGAAAQVSGGLNALGLENLGPYGAAAGAALSVVTSLFAMHDKALQKEIEASEERQKEFDNMTKNIKSTIEDTLGGIYSYKVSDDTKNTLNKVTSDYERSLAWKKMKIPFRFSSVYSDSTYKEAKEAQSKPDSAYHAELASLMAQRDELQSQRDSESKKKKKDNSKIADYNQQIKEMEQQINTFAQDFLKDIYSIDMKSWASELTDAVVSAWEKGEDAVEAYREKVKDMVKDVTKNIVTQKIMEAALQEPLNYLTGILKDKGKLDETDMDKLADMLYKAGDEVVPQITGIFEALKNRGWDFRDNGSSSSTKNSIQSITEETADIIASYLNSIRLDVSVNREYIKIISDYLKNIPEMNAIAQSQLDAMNQLVSLAEYRNDRLDDMYSWMRSVTKDTGSKSLRIS